MKYFLKFIFILLGSVAVLLAFITPILLVALSNRQFDLYLLRELGPIGDFLGGTTVGFLTFASVMFFIASIIVQM
ncbi:MAG: hypothetical protein ACRCWQ_05025, partial [Bacilli bacterium]